jgi:hypothetical protein
LDGTFFTLGSLGMCKASLMVVPVSGLIFASGWSYRLKKGQNARSDYTTSVREY